MRFDCHPAWHRSTIWGTVHGWEASVWIGRCGGLGWSRWKALAVLRAVVGAIAALVGAEIEAT